MFLSVSVENKSVMTLAPVSKMYLRIQLRACVFPGLVPKQAFEGTENETAFQRDGDAILRRQDNSLFDFPFIYALRITHQRINQVHLEILVTEGAQGSLVTLLTSFLREQWASLDLTQVGIITILKKMYRPHDLVVFRSCPRYGAAVANERRLHQPGPVLSSSKVADPSASVSPLSASFKITSIISISNDGRGDFPPGSKPDFQLPGIELPMPRCLSSL